MSQRLLVGLLALTLVVCAQRRVDPRNTYNRIIAIVPLTGSGTAADPKRPKYAQKRRRIWFPRWALSSAFGAACLSEAAPRDSPKVAKFAEDGQENMLATFGHLAIFGKNKVGPNENGMIR